MEKIVVKIEVDEKNAILAGSIEHGMLEVRDPLSSLTESQRKELLTCRYNSELYLIKNNVCIDNYHASKVLDADIYKSMIYYPSSSSIEELKKTLDARIMIRKALQEKIKVIIEQEEIDKKLLRDVDLEIGKNPERYIVEDKNIRRTSREIESLKEKYYRSMREECMPNLIRLEKEIEKYNSAKITERKEKEIAYKKEQYETFLDCYSSNKIERFRANCLPKDELDEVIKCVIFDAFEESKILTRYIKLQEEDILSDENDCNHDDCVSYRVIHVGNVDIVDDIVINSIYIPVELTSKSFDALKYIIGACKEMQKNNLHLCEKVGIRIMKHIASCSCCDNYAAKYGAKVDIEWNGETYSKEYDIFDEPK